MVRKRLVVLAALWILAALLAGGCVMRPKDAPLPGPSAAAAPTPEPTPVVTHTVEYRMGDALVSSETVPDGGTASPPGAPENTRLLGWTTAGGAEAVPEAQPIHEDTVFYAVTRPLLVPGTDFLFPDENGLLRPESPFTFGDAAAAVRALVPGGGVLTDALARWDAAPEEPLSREDLLAALEALFPPEELAGADGLLPDEGDTVTRARAAACLVRLMGGEPEEENYYPDVAPEHPAAAALAAAAVPGTLTPEALAAQAKEGFVWFSGYLYRPDENGYFLTDQVYDSLYFDGNGRYTCGSEELDGYVAETIVTYTAPENTRLDDLHALYFHVKNDFEYLRRNFYASGATGWDIEEALTIFRTNKGNCYCYTGAFCALARGMGYNAVAYSGTIGIQEQAHAWTEITLEDGIYICDPEIEMNYWVWMKEYTDNFMVPREKSAKWNYISLGRTVEYE